MTNPYLLSARQALDIEIAGIAYVRDHLDDDFIRAVDVILATRGPVVVMGMGKSGHIGKKIAATLASTGTPAFFVHPGEAAHGDLGMLATSNVVIALSNSGESQEIIALLPHLKRSATTLISVTGNPASTLARDSEIHLNAHVEKEACPLNLAPTASTTAALALSDALAVVLLEQRGFSSDDFARSHPGGNLGRRLLTRVDDIMRTDAQLPRVFADTLVIEALLEMTSKGMAMTTVVGSDDALLGVFTDGDLRRLLEQQPNLSGVVIRSVLNSKPLTIESNKLASEALAKMEARRVNQIVVVSSNTNHSSNTPTKLLGAIHIHDLTRAKII